MQFILFTLVFIYLPQGFLSAQLTSSSPQNRAVVYACAGGSVTLLWKYTLSSDEVLGDIVWYYDGQSQEMVAILSHGQFLPVPAFANRVLFVDNAGITVSHLTVAESGNYSVEINVYGQSGATHTVLRRSVLVQVGDRLMTQDGHLHVTQKPEAVLDTRTAQWTIQLQCGTFTFHGDPPYQVEWIMPSGKVAGSSDFSDNHFNLLLSSPIQGGNYTCRISPQQAADACLHGNAADHVQASINVDKTEARLSLLEKENEQLKHSDSLLRQDNERLSRQVQSLEEFKVKVVELQDRLERLDNRIRQQIGFHATGLQSSAPPEGAPLVVNYIHYNHGEAYNATTGYFTAPLPGVYFFVATSGAAHNSSRFYLYVDNVWLSFAYSSDHRDVVSAHAVVHMLKEQRVWINSHGDGYDGVLTMFSGFLLSADP